MSSIVDVYLHGSVHLTNPGLEELLADTRGQGTSRSLLGPRGPVDLYFSGLTVFIYLCSMVVICFGQSVFILLGPLVFMFLGPSVFIYLGPAVFRVV